MFPYIISIGGGFPEPSVRIFSLPANSVKLNLNYNHVFIQDFDLEKSLLKNSTF